ncbi:MAG: hypothetical protein ABI091_06090 [Ferruginibacter sp.]
MEKSIKFLWLCILAMAMHISLKAQEVSDDTITLKRRIYKISIITSESEKVNGYLANLSDSGLYVSITPVPLSLNHLNNYQSSYSYYHLEKIEIKRKAAAGRGAWQGALIGLAAGAIVGFASGDDPVAPTYNNPNDPLGSAIGNVFSSVSNSFRMTAGEKAVIGGFTGALAGALVGTLVGTLVKKTFIIGRNKEKFHAMKQNILEKLYPR